MADPTLTGLEVLRTAFRPLQEAQQTQQAIVASEIARNRTVQDQKRLIDARKTMLDREYELRKDMAKEAKDLQKQLADEAAKREEEAKKMEQEADDQAWLNKYHKYVDQYLESVDGSINNWDIENPKQLAELRTETQSYINTFIANEAADMYEKEFTPAFQIWLNRGNEAAVGYLMAMPDMTPAAKAELYGMMDRMFREKEGDELDAEIASLIKSERPDINDEDLKAILDKVRMGQWSLNTTPAQKAAGWLDMQNPFGEGQLGQGAGEALFEQFRNVLGSERVYLPGTTDVVPALKQLAPNLHQHLTRPDVNQATMAAQLATQTNTQILGELARVLAEASPIAYARVLAKNKPLATSIAKHVGSEVLNAQTAADALAKAQEEKPGAAEEEKKKQLSNAREEGGNWNWLGAPVRDFITGKAEEVGLGPWAGEAAAFMPTMFATGASVPAWALGVNSDIKDYLGEKVLGDFYTPAPEDAGSLRKAVNAFDPTGGIRGTYNHLFGGPEEAATPPVAPPAAPVKSPDYESQPPRMGEEGMPKPLPEEPLSGMPSTARPQTFPERIRDLDRQLS